MEFDVNEDKRRHCVCELCHRVIIGDREWAGRPSGGRKARGCARGAAPGSLQSRAASLAACARPADPRHVILGFQGLFTARV